MSRGFTHAVAFHGFEGDEILIGGGVGPELKELVREAVDTAIGSAVRVRVATDADHFGGDDPCNIVNRLTAGAWAGSRSSRAARRVTSTGARSRMRSRGCTRRWSERPGAPAASARCHRRDSIAAHAVPGSHIARMGRPSRRPRSRRHRGPWPPRRRLPWLVHLTRHGQETSVVLRVGTGQDPSALLTEVAALELAAEHGIPAPRLLAADLDRPPPWSWSSSSPEAARSHSTVPRPASAPWVEPPPCWTRSPWRPPQRSPSVTAPSPASTSPPSAASTPHVLSSWRPNDEQRNRRPMTRTSSSTGTSGKATPSGQAAPSPASSTGTAPAPGPRRRPGFPPLRRRHLLRPRGRRGHPAGLGGGDRPARSRRALLGRRRRPQHTAGHGLVPRRHRGPGPPRPHPGGTATAPGPVPAIRLGPELKTVSPRVGGWGTCGRRRHGPLPARRLR